MKKIILTTLTLSIGCSFLILVSATKASMINNNLLPNKVKQSSTSMHPVNYLFYCAPGLDYIEHNTTPGSPGWDDTNCNEFLVGKEGYACRLSNSKLPPNTCPPDLKLRGFGGGNGDTYSCSLDPYPNYKGPPPTKSIDPQTISCLPGYKLASTRYYVSLENGVLVEHPEYGIIAYNCLFIMPPNPCFRNDAQLVGGGDAPGGAGPNGGLDFCCME